MSEPAIAYTEETRIAIGRATPDTPSGDCAHVVRRRDDVVLCFLGDVCGHDSRAAAHARDLESRVRELAQWMSPGPLLATLNGALEAVWPSDMFVSAVCFAVDLQTGRVKIALAGQMPPLVRSRSSICWLEMKAGAALGALRDQSYPERELVLGVDDLLIAATDGVTDPLATEVDVLGFAAMARIVREASPDPRNICASMLGEAGRSCRPDDATVLAVGPAISGWFPTALGDRAPLSLGD
jgi:serine phosphatase RsbU (regulator of sigma subunit)